MHLIRQTVASANNSICYDGQYLWLTQGGTPSALYSFNPATHVLSSPYPLGAGNTGPVGMCFDGTSIWLANNTSHTASQYTIGGTGLGNVPSLYGSTIYDCCFDGNYVWVSGNNTTFVLNRISPITRAGLDSE